MILLDHLYNVVASTSETDTCRRYQIRLLPESAIFKAHFPGEPIMPGACIVQLVQELFGLWKGEECLVVKVNNLKFLQVISPDQVTELEVILTQKFDEVTSETNVKADVINGQIVYTRMSLQLRAQ